MKKLLLTLAGVAALAIGANAQNIYLMGSGDGLSWENFPGMIIQPDTDGSYNFTIDNLSGFKMSTAEASGWDGFNAGAFGYSGTFGDQVFSSAGQTVSLAAWGENQDMPFAGSYTITINAERTSMNVKANFSKPLTAPDVYIRGNMNGWGSSAAYKFTNVSWDGTAGTWTWTGELAGGIEFKIADANWGAINYSNNNTHTEATGDPITLSYNQQNMAMAQDFNGTVTLNVTNYSGHTATATFLPNGAGPSYPETMYLIGNIDGGTWNPTEGTLMNNDGEGIYSIESVAVTSGNDGAAMGYFAMTTTLGANESDWDAVNANRFGPAEKDREAVVGVNQVDGRGDVSWSIVPGTYSMTFDYTAKTLTIEKVGGEDPDQPGPTPGSGTIYVVGQADGLNWNLPGKAYEIGDDGNYTFTLSNLTKFKFSSVNANTWDAFNTGAYSTGMTLYGSAVANEEGETLPLVSWGEDQLVPWTGDYSITIKGDFSEMTLRALTAEPTDAPDVYIRGEMNDWGTPEAYKFAYDEATEAYSWTGEIKAGVAFKIADANWGKINYSAGPELYLDSAEETVSFFYSPDESNNTTLYEDFKGTLIFVVDSPDSASVTFNSNGWSGIGITETSEDNPVYFNLQGQKISNPEGGIFIKVAGGKAEKIMR